MPDITSKSMDYQLAYAMSISMKTSCSYHTSPSNLNPSEHYSFANNPGLFSCSSPKRNIDLSNPPSCLYILDHSSCPIYNPDFLLIRKVKTSDAFYYLTRFRFYDGSYCYKIYDAFGRAYSQLVYTQIKADSIELNLEAISLYEQFLKDLSVDYTVEEIDQDCFETPKKERKSYLKNLFAREVHV